MNLEALIKTFLEDLTKVDHKIDQGMRSLAIEAEICDILPYYNKTQQYPKSYISSKNSATSYLGIGATKFFLEEKKIEDLNPLFEQLPDAIIMGGQSFNQASKKLAHEWKELQGVYYFLPRLLITRSLNTTTFQLFFMGNDKDIKDTELFLKELLTNKTQESNNILNPENLEECNLNDWSNYLDSALKEIDKNRFEKVVIARKMIKNCNSVATIKSIIKSWQEESLEHYKYILQLNSRHAFISVTPERLFKIKNGLLEIDSIAGTRPRGSTTKEDQALSIELKNDPKEVREHQIVSNNLIEELKKTCKNITMTKNREVLKLKNVQHLYSQFRGTLNTDINYSTLIKGLHPTAAVGGYPKKEALDFIENHENFNRGLYASPIGHIAKDSCDFAVGIRSVLIHNEKAHIFGGCGIVTGSDSISEWNETRDKMKNFTETII